jgi:hypothetical protein
VSSLGGGKEKFKGTLGCPGHCRRTNQQDSVTECLPRPFRRAVSTVNCFYFLETSSPAADHRKANIDPSRADSRVGLQLNRGKDGTWGRSGRELDLNRGIYMSWMLTKVDC